MKTKKLLTACLLVLLLALAAVLGLTGCSDEEICEHQWGEWSVTTEATCSTKGAKERACSLCSKVQSAEIEALPHDWNAATCTTPKTCKVCSVAEGQALGHIGGVATCEDKAVCTICGESYGNPDPNNHASNGAWTPVSSSKHSQTCTDCGQVYEKAHIWSNGRCVACAYQCQHTWVGSICTGCGATCQHTGGEATCTDRAICEACGNPYGDLLAHSFTVESATAAYRKSPATCDAPATYYYSCACGTAGTETFTQGEALGHTYGDWSSNGDGTHTRTCVNDATHTESGRCSGGEATCTEKAICDDCNEGYGEEPSHDWDEGTETDAPTCLVAGKATFTCTGCGATKEEPVAALGHDMTDVVTEPTCTTKGYTTHTCQRDNCSESYVDTEVEALGHNWDQELSCENGHTCQRENCGATEGALGHSYEQTGSTEADCDEAATKTYTCQREGCGDTYTDPDGDPLGHSIVGVTPTRQLKEGETCVYVQYYECTVCHENVPGTEVTNHTYKAAITDPATCVHTGTKTITCTACNDSYTEDIPADATGHAWVQGTVAEGATERIDTCSNEGCDTTKTVVVYDGSATDAGSLVDKEVEVNGANINLGSDVIDNAIGDQDISLSAGKTEGDDRMDLGLSPEELEQVGDNPIYDFTITGENGQPISQFGEENYVTITLPYALAPGEDVDNIAVWFINDEGELEAIKATYNNGFVTFRTNHFSYYTVTRLTPAERCELYGHADSTKEVEGDCLHDSYTLTVCARCHRTEKNITVEADGHAYECVTTPATCTEAGKNVYTCADCGASYETKIKATGHAWAETENVPATCAAPGHLTKACQNENCDASETLTYAQKKHVFTDTVVAPTCEAYGYTLHDCDNCDYSYTDSNVAAIGHSYEAAFAWDGTTAAVATLTCANDATHTFELEATITSRVIESTCPAGNRTVYTAKVVYNGVAYTDVSAIQSGNGDHQYAYPKYDADNHWTECVCGAKDNVTAHTWGTPVTTKVATCAESGESVAACDCGATKTTVIPATGNHAYDNGYCIECGAEQVGCDHTNLHEVTYNLADYGACDGSFTVLVCNCGEVVIVSESDYEGNIRCDMDEVEEDEGITEDGNMYMSMKVVCSDCGLTVDIYAEAVFDGCQLIATYWETISMNGEVILKATMVETGYDHNTEREIISVGCGEGGIIVYRCVDCGEISTISDIEIECDGEGSQSTETVDGITYQVMTMTCPECGLVATQKMGVEIVSPCEQIQHVILTVVVNGETVVEYKDEMYPQTTHEWEYNYTLKGTTCEDGWTVTRTCSKCGASNGGSGKDHDNEYSEIDLTEYGMCGGYANASICRICGNVEINNVSDYECNWVIQNQDGTGNIKALASDSAVIAPDYDYDVPGIPIPSDGNSYTATCMRCGTVKQVTYSESEKDENCEYTIYNAATYTKDGEVILSYQSTGWSVDHSWQYDYVMNGTSCEDGVTVTSTCADCGYSYTDEYTDHNSNGHSYDLSDYGACGGELYIYACPCGEYSGGHWNLNCNYNSTRTTYTDDAGIEHSVYTYTCTDCGLVMTQDAYTEQSGCYTYYHYNITITVNGEVKLENVSYANRNSNHQWSYDYVMNGTSCEDGVDVTMTCTVCGTTERSYWNHHNTMSRTIDLAESGACEGSYIRISSCACGEEGYVDRSLACKYETVDSSYTDGDGVEHTVYTRTCVECGLSMVEDCYEQTEGCYTYHYITMTVTVNGTEVVSNELFCDGYNSNHSYVYSYRFLGEEDCEQGVYVTQTCANCDYFSEWQSHDHGTNMVEKVDLAEQGGCGGTLYRYACACGKRQSVELNAECPLTWTNNEYLDDDGNLHYVEVRACSACGLRYQTDSYTVRNAATCTEVTTVSGSVTVGTNAVSVFTYENEKESHDYTVSANLMGNTSCEDGVTLTFTCKDCGSSYYDLWHYHYTYELERIELDQYGSACHGYAQLLGCACGREKHLNLGHALCDLDSVSTELWIDGVLNHYYNYAEIRTCAVTDPQCGLKIRYASYWKQEEGSCLAYHYETWQFGYNEQDGTYQRELTYTTQYNTNHTWESTSTNGTWEGGTTAVYSQICSLCGSSELETHYYDANNRKVKYTRVFVNNLDNGEDKRSEYVYEYVWYESKVTSEEYLQYTTRDYGRYIRANGSEYWYEWVYTFDLENGCNRTVTYTNSNGESNSYTEVWHNTSWIHIKDATCTQDGSEGYRCRMCGEITNTWPIQPQHNWVYVTDGHYFCSVCGLENANGASGDIIMEDLTAEYGNGTHYVIGYFAQNNVQFTYYIGLVTADGEEIFIEVEITARDDVRALTFSKEAVLAAAEAAGLAEGSYDVRFTFVPYGADGSFDYAITLTEEETPAEITDDTELLVTVSTGEVKSFTITATANAVWNVRLNANASYCLTLVDSEGNQLLYDGWYSNPFISYQLTAGESYTLQISRDSYDSEHKYANLTVTVEPIEAEGRVVTE